MRNMPEYMVVLSLVNAMMAVLIVMGAYWFVIASGDRITPYCHPYHRPDLPWYSFESAKVRENMCYTSTYCFWTYPILCPLAVIGVNWKNLVDKRLFYECLLNRIFLVQSRTTFLYSVTFWLLIIYGFLALYSVRYMKFDADHMQKTLYWQFREVVFGMLAYFSAVGAFLFQLFSQWSVNGQIISLSNYVFKDSAAAVSLLDSCKFVQLHDFQMAWLRVEGLFISLQKEERMVPDLNTAELLLLTLDMHEKWKGYNCSIIEKLGNMCSLLMQKRYWVFRLLYFEHLKDWRSWRFRFCVGFYATFMGFSILLFCWGMFYTTSHYLLFQHKDMMPREMRSVPAPHEASEVVDRASRVIPKVVDRMEGY